MNIALAIIIKNRVWAFFMQSIEALFFSTLQISKTASAFSVLFRTLRFFFQDKIQRLNVEKNLILIYLMRNLVHLHGFSILRKSQFLIRFFILSS